MSVASAYVAIVARWYGLSYLAFCRTDIVCALPCALRVAAAQVAAIRRVFGVTLFTRLRWWFAFTGFTAEPILYIAIEADKITSGDYRAIAL